MAAGRIGGKRTIAPEPGKSAETHFGEKSPHPGRLPLEARPRPSHICRKAGADVPFEGVRGAVL